MWKPYQFVSKAVAPVEFHFTRIQMLRTQCTQKMVIKLLDLSTVILKLTWWHFVTCDNIYSSTCTQVHKRFHINCVPYADVLTCSCNTNDLMYYLLRLCVVEIAFNYAAISIANICLTLNKNVWHRTILSHKWTIFSCQYYRWISMIVTVNAKCKSRLQMKTELCRWNVFFSYRIVRWNVLIQLRYIHFHFDLHNLYLEHIPNENHVVKQRQWQRLLPHQMINHLVYTSFIFNQCKLLVGLRVLFGQYIDRKIICLWNRIITWFIISLLINEEAFSSFLYNINILQTANTSVYHLYGFVFVNAVIKALSNLFQNMVWENSCWSDISGD